MTEFEKEVFEVMEWYAKETTGFCRKQGSGYIQVSQKASAFLNKWDYHRLDEKDNPQTCNDSEVSQIPHHPI